MKAIRRSALVCAVVAVLWANTAQAADWVWATVWNNTDSTVHLVEIDVHTGAVIDVGSVAISGQPGYVPGIPGLSRHVDGYLYGFDTYGNQILQIDPATALATVVTPVGADLGGWSIGLTVAPDGTYYLTDVQLRTGMLPGPSTPVGDPDVYDADSCDLDPAGTLYATNEDALLTIDTTTGARTLIRSWTDVNIAGVAVDGAIAWAVDNGDTAPGHQWLVTIDLDDGDLTYLHNLPDGYYLATVLPEPATLVLVALGALGLLRRRR